MRTKALKRTLTRIHNYLTINALQVYRGGGGFFRCGRYRYCSGDNGVCCCGRGDKCRKFS